MGYASCYEDNLDARGESKRSKNWMLTGANRRVPPKKQPVLVAKTRSVTSSDEIQQRIKRTKTMKTRRVTSDEIQRRIRRECIRQAKEDMRI